MIRIGALNDDSSNSKDDDIKQKEPPQEVQEENALKLYNEALTEQSLGNLKQATEMYQQILNSNIIQKIKPKDLKNSNSRNPDDVIQLYSKPIVLLKYSCMKNLAVIEDKNNNLETSLDYLNKALEIDSSDVTLWHKTGLIAMKLNHVHYACDCFMEGLRCSPKHWPCLDKLINSLFVLGDYVTCLKFISRAFTQDSEYCRGFVLRDAILQEQPTLQQDIQYLYKDLKLQFERKSKQSKEKQEILLNETLKIKENFYRNKSTSNVLDVKDIELLKKLDKPSWHDLGESLINLHEHIMNSTTYISVLSPVKLQGCVLDTTVENVDKPVEDGDDVGDKVGKNDESPVKEWSGGVGVGSDDCCEKRKKNRGSALMEELLWSGKRRSARVRSTMRRDQEPIDVAEALKRILPRKLLHKIKSLKSSTYNMHSQYPDASVDDSMDTMNLYRLFEKQESTEEKIEKEEQIKTEHDIDQSVSSEKYFGGQEEYDDVMKFMNTYDGSHICKLIKSFVYELAAKWDKTWPILLPLVFVRACQILLKDEPQSFEMCSTDEQYHQLVQQSQYLLLYGEICFQLYSNTKSADNKSEYALPLIYLQNMMELVERREYFTSDQSYLQLVLRLLWLRCHMLLANNLSSLVINTLHHMLSLYEQFPALDSHVVLLKNCKKHNVIKRDVVNHFLLLQSRKKSLVEVVQLYEDGSYKELTEILKESFTDNEDVNYKDVDTELVPRQTQLSMLVNGLYHLDEYKDCIYWLEVCCYDVLHNSYSNSKWLADLDGYLVAIKECLELGELKITSVLPQQRVVRFAQTLSHAICKQLDDGDKPPTPSAPWIMLYHILNEIELDKKKDGNVVDYFDSEEFEDDIPASVLILFTAHEYLGRREWCQCNDSVLLFFIMDQIIPRLRLTEWSTFRETITQHLEQVVYCLYSHPNKKSKARYLTDHNVPCIPLTWQKAMVVFELFRPDETPSYDSLRTNLISSDTEVLFRRIAALIPDENDPVQNSDKMTDFIIGKRNDVPEPGLRLPEPVQDLFYVLGDYYFKNHESAKAVNYLMIDLCANPTRVDSWASMALSRAALLEQLLNSCEPIKDEQFHQDALSALRCYQHCLQLDNNQCTLWIEYGTFVYTVHSFCSQKLKLQSDSLSLEQFDELETKKNEMLDTAKQAFVNANLIWYNNKEERDRQDERWLHHYMLGKICEKHNDMSYFDHYDKAAEYLYENNAEYPNKVGYNTPQTLSVESLEVYYRIHVCIIKILELNEGEELHDGSKNLFNKYLDIAANSPFVRQVSKSDLVKLKVKEEQQEKVKKEKEDEKMIKDLLEELLRRVEGTVKEETEEIKVEEEEKTKEVEEKTGGDEEIIESLIMEVTEEPNEPKVETEDSMEVIELKDSETDVEDKVVETVEQPALVANEHDYYINQQRQLMAIPKECQGFGDFGANLMIFAELAAADSAPQHVVKPVKPMVQRVNVKRDFITLEDIKATQAASTSHKRKRKTSASSSSSESNDSGKIKYDDETSSDSSSSSCTMITAKTKTSTSSSSDSSDTEAGEKSKKKKTKKPEKANVKQAATPKNSENKKKENNPVKTIPEDINEPVAAGEQDVMLKKCLRALEICAMRFPQHYKSVYRLAHFYFRSKQHRDLVKCRELLLGQYKAADGNLSGLFAERKNNNFFNGIWRIPAGDVDRAGSFAAHMSRSVLLLMEVLRDLKDHKMLLELCLQLRKLPEPDKKYLRDDERMQLSGQALTISLQTLRKNIRQCDVMTLPLVLETYRCQQKVLKHYSAKEVMFSDVLLDAFKRLGKGDKCTLDQALRFCQNEIAAMKSGTRPTPGQNLTLPAPTSTSAVKAKPKSKPAEKKKLHKPPAPPAPVVKKQKPVVTQTPTGEKKPKPNKPKLTATVQPNLPPATVITPLPATSVIKHSSAATTTKQSSVIINPPVAKPATVPAATATATKSSEKQTTSKPPGDKLSMINYFERMSKEYQSQQSLMYGQLMNPFYQYPANNDYMQQFEAYNKSMIRNYFTTIPKQPKKKKSKPSYPQMSANQINKDVSKLFQDAKTPKTKTTFNIDDILAKPSTSDKNKTQKIFNLEDKSKYQEKKYKNVEEIKTPTLPVPAHTTVSPVYQDEAINLSPSRRSDELKKILSQNYDPKKRACLDESIDLSFKQRSEDTKVNKLEPVQIVIIDD